MIRLFIPHDLSAGARLDLDEGQSRYLGAVMRQAVGDAVLVFNGRDGEWQAAIAAGKRADKLLVLKQMRAQDRLSDITYAFAPLKHARLDYMVQKAIEMGAAKLQPVVTRHTQTSRVNTERMRANVIEAAEQCGILSIAEVGEPLNLQKFLDQRDSKRLLIFCDEAAEVVDPIAALAGAREASAGGIDVIIGPEGGFAEEERVLMLKQPSILRLALGPRIMRADTAAVAALAVIQAVLGDWAGGHRNN